MPVYPKERITAIVKKIPEEIKDRLFCFMGDIYLCEEIARQVIKRITSTKKVSAETIPAEEITAERLAEGLYQTGLFHKEKLIWIKNASKLDFLDSKKIKKIPHYLILTLSEGTKVPSFLKDEALFIDLTLRPHEKETWTVHFMQSFLQRVNKRISPAAQKLLVRYIGFNLGILKNSLQMLLNYIGEREVIEEQDVTELIIPTKEEGIFVLAEKLTNAPVEDVLFLLKQLLEQGVHPLAILSVLAKEVRCLMEIKEIIQQKTLSLTSYNQFIKTAYPLIKKENLVYLKGLPPYVIFLFCQRAQKYSLAVLKAIHQQLLLAEIAMKSTSKNAFYHLEMLVLFWCEARERQ